MFLSEAKSGNSTCEMETLKKKDGEFIIRYSNKSDDFLKIGFKFVICENTMNNMSYNEKGDFTGSTGITKVGEDPEDLTYSLEGVPGIRGVFFKCDLTGYGLSGSLSTYMRPC